MWNFLRFIPPMLRKKSVKMIPICFIGGILGGYIYKNKVELQTRINTMLNANNSLDNDLLLEVLKEDNEISDESDYDIRSEKKSQF